MLDVFVCESDYDECSTPWANQLPYLHWTSYSQVMDEEHVDDKAIPLAASPVWRPRIFTLNHVKRPL